VVEGIRENDKGPSGGEMGAAVQLRATLEREHEQIDAGIEHFLAHGATESSSVGLLTALTALRRHIYLEEELLFPALKPLGLLAPIFVMLSEHRDIWQTMDLLEAALLEGSSSTDLQTLGATLLAQLDRHNTKEEPIVYAQADAGLSSDVQTELSTLIETAEPPVGWTCQMVK
jgi:regulator of cell morphogenesis and NO signaling